MLNAVFKHYVILGQYVKVEVSSCREAGGLMILLGGEVYAVVVTGSPGRSDGFGVEKTWVASVGGLRSGGTTA